MKGSWIGPADIVAKALELQNPEVVNGQFYLKGPEIEYLLRDEADDEGWNIVEVKPETMCVVAGKDVPVVSFLASFQRACRVSFGLPIAKRNNDTSIAL